MSFLSVLETALNEDVITPETEEQINETLWTQDFNDEEMAALHSLFEKLEAGETQITAA